jgi:hypothetical protein
MDLARDEKQIIDSASGVPSPDVCLRIKSTKAGISDALRMSSQADALHWHTAPKRRRQDGVCADFE